MRFFETIDERLAPDAPFVIERSGYLFLAHSEDRLARFRDNVALQNALGIPSEIVTPGDIARIAPVLRRDGLVGGAFCAEDGFLEDCHGVTNAFAARARDRGVRVTYDEVLELTPSAGGWRLRTPRRVATADRVVVATGADAVGLLAGLVSLPLRREPRRLAFSAPMPGGLLPPLTAALERGFAAKQLTSGVFYMGWLGEREDADDLTFVEETLTRGVSLLPFLDELPVRRVLSGVYDTTPDRRPLLGEVDGHAGLWLAVGFSGHGFMIAPAVAEIVGHGLCDLPTLLPVDAFSPDRFAGQRTAEGLFI
jgi:sarcosine oxidase subunit beta